MSPVSRPLHHLLLIGVVVALALAAGCLAVVPSPPAAEPTAATIADANGQPANGDAASADTSEDESVAEPTPTAVPTPRPTPRPLPTPVPPSQALQPAATTLETKLAAFRAAARSQDVATSLKLQRELLSAADDADTALKADKSPSAQSVRSAIAEIRTGVAGDPNGLDHAESALRQVLGLNRLTGDQNGQTAAGDLHSLSEDVHNLRQAIQGHNQGDALRLQGQLLNEVPVAQKLATNDQSEQGKALRDALATLQKGLDGDMDALATASAALDKLDSPITSAAVAPAAPDLSGLAASLATKLDAFQTATGAGSRADVLRLQQDILAEIGQDTTLLATDHSPQATALRTAIEAARAGVSGDLDKLAGARTDLGKIAGPADAAAATAAGAPAPKPITDLKHFATQLDGTVAAFETAIQKNDTSTMLRLQKQLADQADQAEASLKGVQSKPANDVLAGVAAIRTAMAGDLTKLDDARASLRAVANPADAPPAAAAAGHLNANPTNFDPQPVVGSLRDKLTSVRDGAQEHQAPDELARRRDALKQEIAHVDASLQGVTDPRADRLRAALTTAREAAAGDDAKAAAALTALTNALGGQ